MNITFFKVKILEKNFIQFINFFIYLFLNIVDISPHDFWLICIFADITKLFILFYFILGEFKMVQIV